MGAISKYPEPPNDQCGLWLYFNKGKVPVLQRAFFRARPADLLGDLERGKGDQAGFRWDKSIKAFCLLCVHYVIHASDAKYEFSDDSRKKKSGPDAAETLSEVLNRRGSWPTQLFQSKSPDIRKKIFRSTNHEGAPEKPFTRIFVENKWLPPTAVRIFYGGDNLSLNLDKATLWGLLTTLRKESPDFKSLRGTLPDSDGKAESIELHLKSKTEGSKNIDTDHDFPAMATQTGQNYKPLAVIFIPLTIPSIISHITISVLPARGSVAVETFLAEILTPECINLIAQKLVGESIETICAFYETKLDAVNVIKDFIAKTIASNNTMRERFTAKIAGSGYRNMLRWFHVFSPYCDKQIVIEVGHVLNTAVEDRAFRRTFKPYVFEEGLAPLIKHFQTFGSNEGVSALQRAVGEAFEEDFSQYRTW